MSSEEYVQNVRTYLTEKHGEVKPEWEGLLQMMQDEFEMYTLAKKEVYTNGMTVVTARGLTASPFIKIFQDSAIQIQKIMDSLGVSPKMINKIKKEEKKEDEDDFLGNLIK